MASTYLSRTTGTPTNAKKFTLSGWFKLAFDDTTDHQFLQHFTDSNNREHIYFSSNQFRFYCLDGGSTTVYLDTNRKFRDTNAWYHIVLACDTTQSTASDRVKLYVNGVQETSFATATYPAQDFNFKINTNSKSIVIGRYMGSNDFYYDGIISHFHFIDGTQYAASTFGSTDSTTGEWKINTSPSVTYGNNGWFLFKDNASVTDQSGEGNNWTTTAGTLTKTEDNPSNNFARLSPGTLPRNSGETIANANLFLGTSAAIWNSESSAFGIARGKYYFEVKLKDNGTDRRFRWGLQKNDAITKTGENKVLGGADNNAIGYATAGEGATQGIYFINQTSTTMSDGDINEDNAIYGYAIDLDNQRMYGHMNGSWFHSGNPSAGSGGIDVSSFYTVGEPLFPSFTTHNSNLEINFGNGYFGTTAVATNSGNGYQDVDGNGIFNYTVPTNFRALCTKGINQ